MLLTRATSLTCLFTLSVLLQEFRRTPQGTLSDPSQAARNATATLRNLETGIERKTTAGATGYLFSYLPGLITHFWHGPKHNRQYLTRWRILNESQFDPALDIKRDAQGLYQLTSRNKKLMVDLMAYFRQRNEDSIDL